MNEADLVWAELLTKSVAALLRRGGEFGTVGALEAAFASMQAEAMRVAEFAVMTTEIERMERG